MSKTPTKHDETSKMFTPKELKTPSKDLPGVSKTVHTHISSLHGLISDWKKFEEKGLTICKTISALKLHEFKDDFYPSPLGPLTMSLLDVLECLKDIVKGVERIKNQLNAVCKLHPTDRPIIYTWTALQMFSEVDNLHTSILKEYTLKQTVTENIAHCRDEKIMDIYVSAWEFEVYLDIESIAYMFAEVGLSGVT